MTEAERIEIETRARHDQNNREQVLQLARDMLSDPRTTEADRELAAKILAAQPPDGGGASKEKETPEDPA